MRGAYEVRVELGSLIIAAWEVHGAGIYWADRGVRRIRLEVVDEVIAILGASS